jgi:hypothetical protein
MRDYTLIHIISLNHNNFFKFQGKMLETLVVTNVVPKTGGVMIFMKLSVTKMMPSLNVHQINASFQVIFTNLDYASST